jgi:hypothetical protein
MQEVGKNDIAVNLEPFSSIDNARMTEYLRQNRIVPKTIDSHATIDRRDIDREEFHRTCTRPCLTGNHLGLLPGGMIGNYMKVHLFLHGLLEHELIVLVDHFFQLDDFELLAMQLIGRAEALESKRSSSALSATSFAISLGFESTAPAVEPMVPSFLSLVLGTSSLCLPSNLTDPINMSTKMLIFG